MDLPVPVIPMEETVVSWSTKIFFFPIKRIAYEPGNPPVPGMHLSEHDTTGVQ